MEHEFALEPVIAVELRARGRDRALAALARRQHATVARRQLIALGFSRHAIARMIAKDQARVVHRGVYAVGPSRLTREGRWTAAVLAVGLGYVLSCSSGDALSRRSASALWQLSSDDGAETDVTTARRGHRRPGIRTHFAQLPTDEITSRKGIPVTTVARTLLDLAAVLSRRELERAMHEAEVRRLWDVTGLHALIERYLARRGTRTLRAIIADQTFGGAITRSELELCFVAFLSDHGFPRHQANRLVPTAVGVYECDFVWPDARLIVELDGYETHGTRMGFEEDRARDRALAIAGWRVIRITWRQLTGEPQTVARDLWELLGHCPPA